MAQSDKAKDHVERYKASNGADGHMGDQMRGVYPLYDEYKARIGDARQIPLVGFEPD